MIEHISLFKLRPEYDNEQAYQDIIDAFNQLDKNKLGILDFVISQNRAEETNLIHGFNVGLRARFANRETLQTYLSHPEHLKVAKVVTAMTSNIIVADLES